MKASDDNGSSLVMKEQTNDDDIVCIGTTNGIAYDNLDGSLFQDGPLQLPQRLPFTSTQISNSGSKSVDVSVDEQNLTIMSARKFQLLQNDRDNAHYPPSKRNRSLIAMDEALGVSEVENHDASRTDAGKETSQKLWTENNVEANDIPTFVISSTVGDSSKCNAVTTNIRSGSPQLFDSDDDFFDDISSSNITHTDDPNSSVTASSVEQQRKSSQKQIDSKKCSNTKKINDKENNGTVCFWSFISYAGMTVHFIVLQNKSICP